MNLHSTHIMSSTHIAISYDIRIHFNKKKVQQKHKTAKCNLFRSMRLLTRIGVTILFRSHTDVCVLHTVCRNYR